MKIIHLQCPQPALVLLQRILIEYADAAYPPGASECAQSAHQAMHMAAQSLLDSYDDEHGTTQFNKRMRAQAKAAIEYYFEDPARQNILTCKAPLLALLQGQAITAQQWQTATATS